MEALFERVFVETTVDTDQDGQYDLIAVYIKRPKLDEKVPAVFVANPYMLHCNEDWYDLYDVIQIYRHIQVRIFSVRISRFIQKIL